MRSVVFCAHDPGGYDVVYPVYQRMKSERKTEVFLFLAGPSGERVPKYRADIDEIFECMSYQVDCGNLRLVVTGTSWNSDIELKIIRYCKKMGIPTISILDYWSNYRSRFQSKNEVIFPDYYFVMDKIAADEAVRDGIAPSILRIVGQPGLDFYVHKQVTPGYNQKLMFLSQPLSIAGQADLLGYTEFKAAESVLEIAGDLGYDVEIKFHSKETPEMVKMYENRRVDGLIWELVPNYAAVVGMSTMGLLQCALMGVPVISYQPGLKGEDLCITNKLRITDGAFSREDFYRRLKSLPGQKGCLLKKKDDLIWLDGKSTERCIEEIYRIGGI